MKQLFYIIHTTTVETHKSDRLTTTALTNLLMLTGHSALQYKEHGNFNLKHFYTLHNTTAHVNKYQYTYRLTCPVLVGNLQ